MMPNLFVLGFLIHPSGTLGLIMYKGVSSFFVVFSFFSFLFLFFFYYLFAAKV